MCSPPLQTQPMNGPMKTAAFFFFNSFLCLFWRLIDFYGIKTVTFFFLSFFFILSHGDVLVDFVSAIEVRPRWTLAVLFISFFFCVFTEFYELVYRVFLFFFFSFFAPTLPIRREPKKGIRDSFFFLFLFFLDPQSTTNNKQTNKQTNKQKHRVALERTSSTECRCVSRTAGDFDVGDAPETKPPDILVFLLFFFFFSFFFSLGLPK